MKLLKVHGSGNDFYLLDEENLDETLTEDQLRMLTRKLCDRTIGLNGGADGVLYVCPSQKKEALAKMRVINADGSEASMCGNGLRTVARYLSEKYALDTFKVETMYAQLAVEKQLDLAKDVMAFGVEISPVNFNAKQIGMNLGCDELLEQNVPEFDSDLKFSAVSVPNPHLITFCNHQTLISNRLGKLAEMLNDGKNPYFPDGVNVSFVEILAKDRLFVRTYERGVGYTNACGTAMSASSLMHILLNAPNLLEQRLTVLNPGGMVQTIVHQKQDKQYFISLIGNATVVAHIEIKQVAALQGDFSEVFWQETIEQDAYEKFITQLEK